MYSSHSSVIVIFITSESLKDWMTFSQLRDGLWSSCVVIELPKLEKQDRILAFSSCKTAKGWSVKHGYPSEANSNYIDFAKFSNASFHSFGKIRIWSGDLCVSCHSLINKRTLALLKLWKTLYHFQTTDAKFSSFGNVEEDS